MKEFRTLNFDVHADNNEKNGNYISGRAIVYDSETDIGEFREIIERGALDETNLKDVPFFVNHDVGMIPLARSRNNNENSTLQLIHDEEGLAIRANLDTENNEDARALYSAATRGDIDGMSFMFEVTPDGEEWGEWEAEKPLRRIKNVKRVFEVSAVTFPAYETTNLSVDTRSASDVLDNARTAMDIERKREEHRKELAEKLRKAR